MRNAWLTLIALVMLLPAFANDGAVVGEGGRVRFMDGERTDIRMVREHINIDVYHAFYLVNVDFLFRNDGDDTLVLMGFPESGAGDILPSDYQERTGFQEFATWVDGEQVAAERKLSADARESGYQAFWVKQVAFGKGQVRKIRVRYKALAGAYTNGERWVRYDFTGGTWKGQLDESTLTLSINLPGAWLMHPETTGATPPQTLQCNGTHVAATWKHWQGDGRFILRYATTDAGWRWISGLSGAPLSTNAITLQGSGKPEEYDWLPQALERNGVSFISFVALDEAVRAQLKHNRQTIPVVAKWDAQTQRVSLQIGLLTLGYLVGAKEMTVDTAGVVKKVALPAAPFMSPPMHGCLTGRLYVPCAASVAALGGTVTPDAKTRELHLTFGDFWDITPAR